ncbi:FimB/Mfa2 family fimbrial subunit [Phocaeicola sp.]
MRKFLFLPLLALLASCGKNEDCDITKPKPEDLVTPALYATLEQNSTDPYSGPLEVLPCQPDGSIYVGNYTATGSRLPVPAYYAIENGIGKSKNYPLRLPVGTYNVIYWGYPNFFNTADAIIADPTLIIGEELDETSLGLHKVPTDTVYYPVHDLVFGTQDINIGTEDLQAHLKRASAALGVIATETNGNAFSTAIDSMWVYIGGIYSNLNYFSAQPEGTFKTIRFGMSPSADRKQWSKEFVSVFPSQPAPLFQIFVQLKNGTIKHYQQKLTSQLNAGTKTTVNLSIDGVLLEEGSTGGFQVDKWQEQNENIHVPLH